MFDLIKISISAKEVALTSGFGVEIYIDTRWILYGTLAVIALRTRKILMDMNKRGN